MNKTDLKDGMVLTCANGNVRVFIGDGLYKYQPRDNSIGASHYTKTNDIIDYNYNLTNKYCTDDNIIKIEYNGQILWKRAIITEDEKALLRLLDKKFKYIVRDDGYLYVYTDKPVKKPISGTWVGPLWSGSMCLNGFEHNFRSIQFSNDEPCLIEDLLKYGDDETISKALKVEDE